jgi:hypothetical protein
VRLPRVILIYVSLIAVQPMVFLATGAVNHVPLRGAVVMTCLVVGLARRSRIAWMLLLLSEALPLLALGAVLSGGHVLWTHVAAMSLTGVALEIALLSTPMLAYVGLRAGPTAPASPVRP